MHAVRTLPCCVRRWRRLRHAIALGAVWFLNGCVATPTEHTEALANSAGATITRIQGEQFEHVVVLHVVANDSTLHVYFPGDGTPWIRHTTISDDPTPKDPVALRLMLEDSESSIYIGRPCYLGLESTRGCSSALWTGARYSQAVVDSMASVVRTMLDRLHAKRAVLFGYSGGGVLAVLVANRVQRVEMVVTIAANLDTAAWTGLHGYSPLSESLNPMNVTMWRKSLRQIHFVGESDSNVPPVIAQHFVGAAPQMEVRVMPGFDHHCCWVEVWPTLLESLGSGAHVDRASLPPQHSR